MSAAGPSQGANCSPSGGSAAAPAASVGAVTSAAGPSQGANRDPSRVLRIAAPALIAVLLVAAWQGLVVAYEVPPYIVPSPAAVLQTLVADRALPLGQPAPAGKPANASGAGQKASGQSSAARFWAPNGGKK